jgi:hypothetical protein
MPADRLVRPGSDDAGEVEQHESDHDGNDHNDEQHRRAATTAAGGRIVVR